MADPCAVAAGSGETVTIAASRPDHRIELADGRLVRLAGIDLASLSLPAFKQQEATLFQLSEPDRHGTIHATLYVDGQDLALLALEEGHARVRPASGATACYTELLRAEDKARNARLGLWADPAYAVADAASPQKVAERAGSFAILSGRITHIGITKTTVWIDFGKNWREDVAIAIPRKIWPSFEAAGLTRDKLEGSHVRIRGVVTMRDGPRLNITEPAAIEWIEPALK